VCRHNQRAAPVDLRLLEQIEESRWERHQLAQRVPTAPDFVKELEACDACPVDALTVWDEAGRQIVP